MSSIPHPQHIILDYEPIDYFALVKRFACKFPQYLKTYLFSFFPIVTWIHRYNLTWLVSDVIAGVTTGIIVVPQGMGYAKIAELPPVKRLPYHIRKKSSPDQLTTIHSKEYGLYSSFIGLAVYCIFGTSKDISIGPTAVMSLLVGQTVLKVAASNPNYTGPEVAVAMALFGGIIAIGIGCVRLGILVDFIPEPAIAGFMSGSAITIAIGQYPKLFGMTGVNTHDAAYLIFGNFFKHLPDSHLDVAFGLIGLGFLYLVKWGTARLTKAYPRYEKALFFANIMRNGVLVIFGTLIAFLIHIGKSKSPIRILETVPAGFQAIGVPSVDTTLLSEIAGTLPSVVIILILEHVAIAKSFGRKNNYKINADQEIVAIGIANVLGCFFGAYPNTGSFSRTAIAARSGVRTPLAGVFSAAVVVLCLYALTPAFYYIPDAILAAVIIHAVQDLVSGPKFVQHLWHINPLELFTFLCGVIVTFFTSVEYGIYVSVGLSICIMLVRIARPRYAVLGRIPIHPYDPNLMEEQRTLTGSTNGNSVQGNGDDIEKKASQHQNYVYVRENHPTLRDVVELPPPGVLIFRFDESLTYPNSGFISDKIMHYVQDHYSSGAPPPTSKGERAWNDPSPLVEKSDVAAVMAAREASGRRLKAIALDFSAVNHLDSTGVQALLDLRLAINRYAGHEIEWHFASIATPFIRNALIVAGFGKQNGRETHLFEVVPVVPITSTESRPCQQSASLENLASDERASEKRSMYCDNSSSSSSFTQHSTKGNSDTSSSAGGDTGIRPGSTTAVIDIDSQGTVSYYYPLFQRGVPLDRYPFFHWDLEDAVRAATFAAMRS
ncbi:sulfate transporter family-domain-containing protein [Dichotomocladium elegans]|nr:sulfate transporter family-domain-containing protein [Dichotomocladium elegans]